MRLFFWRSRQAAEAILAHLPIASGLSMGKQAEQGKQEGGGRMSVSSDKLFQQHPGNYLCPVWSTTLGASLLKTQTGWLFLQAALHSLELGLWLRFPEPEQR